jgi:TPR repeat protein
MRRDLSQLATGLLLALAFSLGASADRHAALELCLQAFEPGESSRRQEIPPELVEEVDADPSRMWELLASPETQRLTRKSRVRELRLLRQASDLGHLPSRYLLATWFGQSTRDLDPPIEGLPDAEEQRKLLRELALAGFPLAEYAVAMEAKDEWFHPNRRVPGWKEQAAAKRAECLEWLTSSARQGHRSAWESLALFYPDHNNPFEASSAMRPSAPARPSLV